MTNISTTIWHHLASPPPTGHATPQHLVGFSLPVATIYKAASMMSHCYHQKTVHCTHCTTYSTNASSQAGQVTPCGAASNTGITTANNPQGLQAHTLTANSSWRVECNAVPAWACQLHNCLFCPVVALSFTRAPRFNRPLAGHSNMLS